MIINYFNHISIIIHLFYSYIIYFISIFLYYYILLYFSFFFYSLMVNMILNHYIIHSIYFLIYNIDNHSSFDSISSLNIILMDLIYSHLQIVPQISYLNIYLLIIIMLSFFSHSLSTLTIFILLNYIYS